MAISKPCGGNTDLQTIASCLNPAPRRLVMVVVFSMVYNPDSICPDVPATQHLQIKLFTQIKVQKQS